MAKKKEYNNVFAKMMEYHNNEVVPFIKTIYKYGPIKVSKRRVLQLRDSIENTDKSWISVEYLNEYLVLNKFILDQLDESVKSDALSMLKKDKDNIIIRANVLYNLIESKKKEIEEKLKDA